MRRWTISGEGTRGKSGACPIYPRVFPRRGELRGQTVTIPMVEVNRRSAPIPWNSMYMVTVKLINSIDLLNASDMLGMAGKYILDVNGLGAGT